MATLGWTFAVALTVMLTDNQRFLLPIGVDQVQFCRFTVGTTLESPGRIPVTFAFNGETTGFQELECPNGADAATCSAGAAGILAQFILCHPHGQVAFDILDGVVPGVGIEGIDRDAVAFVVRERPRCQ